MPQGPLRNIREKEGFSCSLLFLCALCGLCGEGFLRRLVILVGMRSLNRRDCMPIIAIGDLELNYSEQGTGDHVLVLFPEHLHTPILFRN